MSILDNFRLDGKVAVVTGGGQGIGRGIAIGFAEAGADVVVGARTQADLDEVVARVEETGRRALAVVTDVLVAEDRERLVAAAVEQFGRLDVLVNNAGGTGPRAAMQTSERFIEMAMRFNVVSPFLMSQLAAQAMVDTAGSGSIVNISSRSADLVMPSFAAYGAGKAALNQLTRNLAVELAPLVRVNAIGVGGVATKGLEVVLTDDALRAEFEANTPMRRPGPARGHRLRRALLRLARLRPGSPARCSRSTAAPRSPRWRSRSRRCPRRRRQSRRNGERCVRSSGSDTQGLSRRGARRAPWCR